jgi:hypothetical protein
MDISGSGIGNQYPKQRISLGKTISAVAGRGNFAARANRPLLCF